MPSHDPIELVPVAVAERNGLYELVDEYLAELMNHRDVPVGPVDAASYTYLPMYWEEVGRHPFFIAWRSVRVGFALVRIVQRTGTIQMSDFFIRAQARRGGLGRLAVRELWRRFPGSWELQVHPRNEEASTFWRKCIHESATGVVRAQEVQEEDGRRVQYNFEIARESY